MAFYEIVALLTLVLIYYLSTGYNLFCFSGQLLCIFVYINFLFCGCIVNLVHDEKTEFGVCRQ